LTQGYKYSMIVCTCRRISTNDFSSEEELKGRILQDDFKCGLCQLQYLDEEKELPYEVD